MIIYNVTIKIDPEIEEAWLQWMHNGHMQAVVDTGMFSSFHFFELLQPSSEDGRTFVAQYETDSLEKYERYVNEFGPDLKKEGMDKFGDKMVAFRTVLEKIK